MFFGVIFPSGQNLFGSLINKKKKKDFVKKKILVTLLHLEL